LGWYVGERKVNCTNAVIDWAYLTMLMTLYFSILINLMIIRSFQCEFLSLKIYTIVLATTLRKQKEDYWILELGSETPYGCNVIIDGISILSSPTCRSANAMYIYNSTHRRERSHGHRHDTTHNLCSTDVSLNDALQFIQKSLGIHHISTN